jgi:hypothetical protein
MPPRDFVRAEDLQRSYDQTFLSYEGKLVYATTPQDMGGGVGELVLWEVDNAGRVPMDVPLVKFKVNTKAFAGVKLETPRLGWVKDGRGIRFLYRTSSRQWRFGVHDRVLRYMVCVGESELVEAGGCGLNQEFRHSLLRPPTLFKEHMIGGSWVLSTEYAIYNTFLFHGSHCIGDWENGKFKLREMCDDSLVVLDLKELNVPLHGW